jgi:hypothetical protein
MYETVFSCLFSRRNGLLISQADANLTTSAADYEFLTETFECHMCDDRYEKWKMLGRKQLILSMHTIYEISAVIGQPKYDIFINYAYRNDFIFDRIKNALPKSSSTHTKGNFSSTNIKICLDNTSTAVIAIINET